MAKGGGIKISKTGGGWGKVVPPPKKKSALARNPPMGVQRNRRYAVHNHGRDLHAQRFAL